MLVWAGKGYKEVKEKNSQATNEPGQVVEYEGALGALQGGEHDHEAQAVGAVPQHGQEEQHVRRAFGGLPLILNTRGRA